MSPQLPTQSNDHSAEFPCQRCGAPGETINGAPWFAENDLFNEVNGSPNGFFCPPCFTDEATTRGVVIEWKAQRV